MKRKSIPLKHWQFALGEEESCLADAREVGEVHTWNAADDSADTWGTGWYRHELPVDLTDEQSRLWVQFGSVYHDATVYLNGAEIGTHKNSGYTPFTMELTGEYQQKQVNYLNVKADSAFSEEILPYKRSFDWANDGGMIRSAKLYVTGANCIRTVAVTAEPEVENGIPKMDGQARLALRVELDRKNEAFCQLDWTLLDGDQVMEHQIEEMGSTSVFSMEKMLEDVTYWHFDQPKLYTLQFSLICDGKIMDQGEVKTGFRRFETVDGDFYLNGEKVRVCGTEWMPGSDPVYGMAEPVKQLEKMLVCLKETNCIYTRFHWQQDEFIFDWCDAHGMMVQEEVPYWGADPAEAGERQLTVSRQQIDEMIAAHRNHPSIIAWGVGNELDGQSDKTKDYIKTAVEYVKSIDDSRLVTYVSNTSYYHPENDGTLLGDVKMINEYCDTWMPDLKADQVVPNVIAADLKMPLVISEYGLCEPVFTGGDKRREELFLEKMAVYRKYSGVSGTINFCLNDYRTQMGEEGEGKYRRRVHGSTDLDGTPKPSYYVVQKECAPFTVTAEGNCCRITCRQNLPCYTMHNYQFHFIGADGSAVKTETVQRLAPGESVAWNRSGCSIMRVYRANGDFAGEYTL